MTTRRRSTLPERIDAALADIEAEFGDSVATDPTNPVRETELRPVLASHRLHIQEWPPLSLGVSHGKSSRISVRVAPDASRLRMSATAVREPRMIGRPPAREIGN